MFNEFLIKEIKETEKKQVIDFLDNLDLNLEDNVEYTVGIYDEEKLIATGSFARDVLKCIGIDPEYQESGLTSKIVTHLIQKEHSIGREHLFLFTKPTNTDLFVGLGFREIERAPKWFSLLEIGPHGIEEYLGNLKKYYKKGKNGGIVVNCNPFTYGHRYLIETSAKMVDNLYVFVVEEDRSLFPFKYRMELIKKETADLKNVTVLNGGQYVISNSTFPNYFVRNEAKNDIVKAQTVLDVRVFGRHIASALDIEKRFVGTEPYCPTTSSYNDAMKEELPKFNIELIEIERKKFGDNYISASTVRQYIREDKLNKIKNLVPKSTYDFLTSKEAVFIIENIKRSDSRH